MICRHVINRNRHSAVRRTMCRTIQGYKDTRTDSNRPMLFPKYRTLKAGKKSKDFPDYISRPHLFLSVLNFYYIRLRKAIVIVLS